MHLECLFVLLPYNDSFSAERRGMRMLRHLDGVRAPAYRRSGDTKRGGSDPHRDYPFLDLHVPASRASISAMEGDVQQVVALCVAGAGSM